MRIGIHCSTGGSLEKAASKAYELGANTLQIFSASPRMWRCSPPKKDAVDKMKKLRAEHDLAPLVVHDSYLINLASADPVIRKKSIEGFAGEIERALIIGAEYLVAHPGNYKSLSREEGIHNVARGIDEAWVLVPAEWKKKPKLTILLENTAGAGAQLGGCFEDLAAIRDEAARRLALPIGFCLDTCHCHVAGYNISDATGVAQTLKQAASVLGLSNIPVFHANDAKAQLGSHLDRHEHIGAGYIGGEGFRRILNHPQLRDKAFILETPLDKPGDDLRNVTALKELLSPKKRSTTKKSKRSGVSAGKKTRPST